MKKFIKNYEKLSRSPERKVVLELIESALSSIQPENVLERNFSIQNNTLKINDQTINLFNFERIFLLGFGKGSAKISSIIEQKLGNILTAGYVIDVADQTFSKIDFTLGLHPLPSQDNFDFTEKVIGRFGNRTERDLVLIVTCGGGSVLFEKTWQFSLDQMIAINKALLQSGASIQQVNVIRKHLSQVKGGGLAKILYPTTVFNMIFSDVPGNDLSVIASGPTVFDKSTCNDALEIVEKYDLSKKISLTKDDFIETPKENKYFERVSNILMLSNRTALEAMEQKSINLGYKAKIYSDNFQGVAKEVGKKLIEMTRPRTILLVGGETTVKVTGKGEGGRNQEVVLGALDLIGKRTIIASFDSDGWDNSEAAGALADSQTLKKAKELGLDSQKYLQNNNSLAFFKACGDAILTGRLPSNVSDLMIVLKK